MLSFWLAEGGFSAVPAGQEGLHPTGAGEVSRLQARGVSGTPLPGEVSRSGARDGFHPPFSFRLAEGRGGFVPPGTTYFCRQAKVGKNQLRGAAPKNPNFLEQGRGGGYIRNDIGSGITYEPWHFQ